VADELDLLVIGGGIAGLTAGFHAATAGRKTLVLTGALLGGNLLSIEAIEGYPGHPDSIAGYELCPTVQMDAAQAGAAFAVVEADSLLQEGGLWRVQSAQGEHVARAVILATGTSFRKLGVAGEDRLFGRGVSQCASCDAPLLRGKPVVVVGGGDSALQEALALARIVSRVTILTSGAALTAQDSFVERVAGHPEIDIRFNAIIEEIIGDNVVTGVRYRDPAGEKEIPADGVFVFIGMQPNTAFLNGLLSADATGKISVDPEMRTGLPGVFAAGTLRAQAACRAIASAGDGKIAALAADRYLTDGGWAS
jgi:thioredoxin reductase (NADPH)